MDKSIEAELEQIERIAKKAAREAIDRAHGQDAPVYGSTNGDLVCFKPDGTYHVLQEADIEAAELACMSEAKPRKRA